MSGSLFALGTRIRFWNWFDCWIQFLWRKVSLTVSESSYRTPIQNDWPSAFWLVFLCSERILYPFVCRLLRECLCRSQNLSAWWYSRGFLKLSLSDLSWTCESSSWFGFPFLWGFLSGSGSEFLCRSGSESETESQIKKGSVYLFPIVYQRGSEAPSWSW